MFLINKGWKPFRQECAFKVWKDLCVFFWLGVWSPSTSFLKRKLIWKFVYLSKCGIWKCMVPDPWSSGICLFLTDSLLHGLALLRCCVELLGPAYTELAETLIWQVQSSHLNHAVGPYCFFERSSRLGLAAAWLKLIEWPLSSTLQWWWGQRKRHWLSFWCSH